MPFFDTVVTVPPMTWTDQRAAIDGLRLLGLPGPMFDPSGRMRATIRTLIALRLTSDTTGSCFRQRCPLVEPWAIPSPWTEWRSYSGYEETTAPMDAGLYFVSDRVPDSSPCGEGTTSIGTSTCGWALRITPSASAPSTSVTMSDGSTWTPVIPENSGITIVMLETDATPTATASISGCSAQYIALYWPPGVLVDPDPDLWLDGYVPADPLPTAPVSLAMSRKPLTTREVPYTPSWINQMAIPQDVGRAGIPRPVRDSMHPDWHQYRAMPMHWIIATSTGLMRQVCGPDSFATPMDTGKTGAATRYALPTPDHAVVMSSPAAVVIRMGVLYVSTTITIYERELGAAAPGTPIATVVFPVGPAAESVTTLPTATVLGNRKVYSWALTAGINDPFSVGFIPNTHHALPFAVVASDGTVIPAGQAPDFQEAITPIVTECTVGVPTVSGAAPGTYRWSGLAAGFYEIPSTVFGYGPGPVVGAIATSAGRCYPTNNQAAVLAVADDGWIELHVTSATGAPPAVIMHTVTPAVVTLATGANSAWPGASYGIGSFTAPASGVYRFAFTRSATQYNGALWIGPDAAMVEPEHVITAGPRRLFLPPDLFPYYPPAKTDTPPTAATYVGSRTYLVGDSPAGEWAGHAGEVAMGCVRPGTIQWQFAPLLVGVWYNDYEWDGSNWARANVSELGHVDVTLTAGQVIYTRITGEGAAYGYDLPIGAAGVPNLSPAGVVTITAV